MSLRMEIISVWIAQPMKSAPKTLRYFQAILRRRLVSLNKETSQAFSLFRHKLSAHDISAVNTCFSTMLARHPAQPFCCCFLLVFLLGALCCYASDDINRPLPIKVEATA